MQFEPDRWISDFGRKHVRKSMCDTNVVRNTITRKIACFGEGPLETSELEKNLFSEPSSLRCSLAIHGAVQLDPCKIGSPFPKDPTQGS